MRSPYVPHKENPLTVLKADNYLGAKLWKTTAKLFHACIWSTLLNVCKWETCSTLCLPSSNKDTRALPLLVAWAGSAGRCFCLLTLPHAWLTCNSILLGCQSPHACLALQSFAWCSAPLQTKSMLLAWGKRSREGTGQGFFVGLFSRGVEIAFLDAFPRQTSDSYTPQMERVELQPVLLLPFRILGNKDCS